MTEQHVLDLKIAFLSVWSMVQLSFAFETSCKLGNVWLFRSDCKLQAMGRSDSFKRECVSGPAVQVEQPACVGLLHWV